MLQFFMKAASLAMGAMAMVPAGPTDCRFNLHTHFEAGVFPSTLEQLEEVNNVTLPPDMWDYQKNFSYSTFDGFGHTYYNLVSVVRTPQDYYTMAKAQLERAKFEEGVCYTEIIICPDCVVEGVSWKEMYAQIKKAIDETEEEGIFYPRLLLTLLRGRTSEEQAVEYVKWIFEQWQQGDRTIVGLNLSGNEAEHPGVDDFVKAYALAKAGGLGLTAHAGELQGPEAVEEAMEKLQIERCGHCTAIMHNSSTLQKVKDRGVHVEVCTTSNKALGAQGISTYSRHPVREFWDQNVSLVIGPDDPSTFGTTISREEHVLINYMGLTQEDVWWGIYNQSVGASFAPDDLKVKLYQMVERAYGPRTERRARLRSSGSE